MESKKTVKATKKAINKVAKTTKPKAAQTKKLAGRPRVYETADDLYKKSLEYFKYCDENDRVYGVVGLCHFLKLDKSTFADYAKHPIFTDTIKQIKIKIEDQKEQMLYKMPNVTGLIFDLKCNYGWIDKQYIESDVKVTSVESLLKDEEVIL